MNVLRHLLSIPLLAGCADPMPPTLDATVDEAASDALVEAEGGDAGEDAPPRCPRSPQDASAPLDWSRCERPFLSLGAGQDAGGIACVPGRAEPCMCEDGRRGVRECNHVGWSFGCMCNILDGGVVTGRSLTPLPSPLPPRLIRPMSGMRASSQRPALRWVLPEGITRARVELCADRACGRVVTRAEMTGESWRPEAPLAAGVYFWRVMALRADAAVAWTSATWEFAVGHCDAPHDTTLREHRDFNGDGYEDGVMRFNDGRSVGVIVWGAAPYPSSFTSIRADAASLFGPRTAMGDLNGDGLTDVAFGITNYERRTSTALPRFDSVQVVGTFLGDRACGLRFDRALIGSAPPAVCDVNGDGFGDVTGAQVEGVVVHPGGARGVRPTPSVVVRFADVAWGDDTTQITCADFNGDGYADVAVANYFFDGMNGKVAVLYGRHDLRLDIRVQDLERRSSRLFGSHLATVELDEDGFADLVVGTQAGFRVCRGAMDGLHCAQQLFLPVRFRSVDAPAPSIRSSGDINGDGLSDVLASSGALATYLSDVRGWLSEQPAYIYLDSSAAIGAFDQAIPGDLDADGWDDVFGFSLPALNPSTNLVEGYLTFHAAVSSILQPSVQRWRIVGGARPCCD